MIFRTIYTNKSFNYKISIDKLFKNFIGHQFIIQKQSWIKIMKPAAVPSGT